MTTTTNQTPNTHQTTNKELTQMREQQAWELRVQCYSQAQIAQILGISQSAVSQILNRVGKRLYEQFSEGAARRIAEQTEQLMHIAQECLNAWQQSKQPSPPLLQERGQGGEVAPPTQPTPPQNETPPESETGEQNPDRLHSQTATNSPPESGVGGRVSSPPLHKERGSGGEVGKSSYLCLALQALAAVRSLWGMNRPYQAEVAPYDYSTKMVIGVDLDRMQYIDGTPVPRKEVDRLMALPEEQSF